MDSANTSVVDHDGSAPRRSGRAPKPVTRYEPEGSSKRKRGDGEDDDGDDDDLDSDDESSSEDDEEDEHPAPRSRNKAAKSGRKKPSIKKPKTNGHYSRIPSRPKKSVRIDAGEKGTGLFGE